MGEAMTTNQTIDGVLVSRELLKRFYTHVYVRPALLDGDDLKLRALLDAPAVQWLAMEVNGKPWIIKEGPNAEKWRAMGYELFPVQPAAQPQGEPVAWMQPGQGGMCISNDVKLHSLKMGGAPASAVSGYSVPLYTEQPAPVSVVMPERSNAVVSANVSAKQAYALGWNACLDEVARLNAEQPGPVTVARPAHANPPPGTEPCGTHHDNDGLDEMRKPAMCDCNQGRMPCRCKP